MLAYPLEAAEALGPERLVVVVGRDGDEVRRAFAGRATFVEQPEPRGTGHAVLCARSALEGSSGDLLLLYGDTPLLRPDTLRRLVRAKAESGAELALLSARLPLPGRIVRDREGRVVRIVEMTDASPEERSLEEGNTGVYLVGADLLWKTLDALDDRNAQGEIYLTDVVGRAVADGRRVEAVQIEDPEQALGVNTRAELAQAAEALRRRKAEELMQDGVTLVDPRATYVDVDVRVGRDTLIEPGCVIRGDTVIGERVHLKAHSVIEWSRIGDDAIVGPCAHLRPGTRLERGVRVGNFVEVKNSVLGEGVKADHLSYIGDADVGAGVSFGCGAIVVNYDGIAKHRTRVEDGAFIGCNVNLIAPVTVHRNAFAAAGSTISQDVPEGALGVARSRQRNVPGWRRRRRLVPKPPGKSED
jgi:bifunctional UDP-N-acetylglucosamine pyrophosphorylase/glucosamine-1-phosphate N-acetyltransferase